MEIFAVIGLGVVASVLAIVLKQYKSEYAIAISIVSGIIIFSYVAMHVIPVFEEIFSMFSLANISSKYAVVLIKSLGICFVTQLASDICRDSGNITIASKIELAGKISVLLIALPLFTDLLEVIYQLIFRL